MKERLKVFYVAHVNDPTWKFIPHRHLHHHELVLVAKGELEVFIKGQRLLARRGDLLWYPAGEQHSERSTGKEIEVFGVGFGPPRAKLATIEPGSKAPVDFRVHLLSRENFEKLLHKDRKPSAGFAGWHKSSFTRHGNFPLMHFDRNGRIEQVFRWMRQIYCEQEPQAQEILDVFLFAVLRELEARPAVEENRGVTLARKFANDNIARPISLDDMAFAAHISKFHFARIFKGQTGISPMKYLEQCRVEAARQLLVNSDLALKEIADRVGFADENHLSRHIRRSFGLPPATLRRNALKQSSDKAGAGKRSTRHLATRGV
jgi:AraC-like DNA-binding protein/mannose-6-phosphate isomerase-like protein (cupin superfamily)